MYIPFPGAYLAPVTFRPAMSTRMVRGIGQFPGNNNGAHSMNDTIAKQVLAANHIEIDTDPALNILNAVAAAHSTEINPDDYAEAYQSWFGTTDGVSADD